jgi:hypothetical protein
LASKALQIIFAFISSEIKYHISKIDCQEIDVEIVPQFFVVFNQTLLYNKWHYGMGVRLFMRAYVVLHGQTDYDAEGRIQGSSDLPLNNTGKEQIKKAGASLKSKGIDMLLAAPQLRTMETAEIIVQQLGLDISRVTKSIKLTERDFGDLEGQLKSEADMFPLSSLVWQPCHTVHEQHG